MKPYKIALAALLAALNLSAHAELTSSVPSVVCGWLDGEGLPTRGWTNYQDGTYGCASNYKELDAPVNVVLKNSLAYYALGSPQNASEVKLVLNIHDRARELEAISELLRASQALAIEAAGQKLPTEVVQAIMEGLFWSQQVGASRVKVIRKDWPTGKGYEIHTILE